MHVGRSMGVSVRKLMASVCVCLTALAAAVTSPDAARSNGAGCAQLLTKQEAGFVLHGLTAGFIDKDKVHPWPQVEGNTRCIWQGKLGQLVLTAYDWGSAAVRARFARQMLCSVVGYVPPCAKARTVQDATDPAVASNTLAAAMRDYLRRFGEVTPVLGVKAGYEFIPRSARDGAGAWAPSRGGEMLRLSCNAFDESQAREQARCADHALLAAVVPGS
jgi:hypothetical protein